MAERPHRRNWQLAASPRRRWLHLALAILAVFGHQAQVAHFLTHDHFGDRCRGVGETSVDDAPTDSRSVADGSFAHDCDHAGDGDSPEDGDDCPFTPAGQTTHPALPELARLPAPEHRDAEPLIAAADAVPPVERLRMAPKHSPPHA